MKILVVDDEPAVRDLLIDILRSLGQAATGFDSGAHALESYAAGRYDLIFTDLGMPGMSGWDLARAIRERDPQVTLAIITGWGAEVSPEAAEEAGADAVVGKPFTIEDIEGLIRVARDRRPMRAA